MLTAGMLLLRVIDGLPLQRLDMLVADWQLQSRGAKSPGPEVIMMFWRWSV